MVLYLRQLPRLRTLSLKGNPVTRFKEFDGYVAAFLPKLMYYEFKMVDPRVRKLHTERNQGDIFKVSLISKGVNKQAKTNSAHLTAAVL